MSQRSEVQKTKPLPRALDDVSQPATRRAPRALAEFGRHTPRAGEPDWPALLSEAKAMAAALRPALEPPRSLFADARRRARGIRTAAQNFRENRRRAASGREDLLPLYFIWTTHRTCNFLCEYCDDHQGHKYPELSTEGQLDTAQAKRLLEIMRTRASSIYFAGGEPTLRKDLPELTRYASDLDYYPIIVNTNASALHRQLELPAWRTWLADTDQVIVSLDALDLDVLREMWVYERPRDVLRNVLVLRELAAEMRVKLTVNAVIQPGRIAHAKDVLDFACDLGIGFAPVPVNVGPKVADGLRDDPAYAAFAALILERKRQGHRITGSRRMNERLLGSAPLACRNTLKPHVDHDGTLFWPCKASVNVAPLRLRVLDYASVDALWEAGCALRDPTAFHGQGPEQCGANCNWAQNYTTDAYAHGLEHPLSLLAEVVDFLRPRSSDGRQASR